MVEDLGRVSHLDALLAAIGPVGGLAIADIGCGEGALDRVLAARGATVTGYDPLIAGNERRREGAGSWRLVAAPADAIPVPDGTFDLVLFIYSLHHVPAAKLDGAMAQARRILKPGGRLYVAEPVAQGPNQYIVELFHDETAVRRQAEAALQQYAAPQFAHIYEFAYCELRRYPDFDQFAARMIANRRFNGYSEEAVLQPAVRARFAEVLAAHDGEFEQPVRVRLFA
ncbi:MAG: methyltransferase domain-containing protein [Stellaceae bacterium]